MPKSWSYAKIGIFLGTASFVIWIIVFLMILGQFNPIPVEIVTNELCDDKGNCSSNIDAIKLAVSFGRLDIISALLALVAIGLGFFALFTFIALKEDARRIAEDTVDALLDDKVEITWAAKRGDIKELIKEQLKKEYKATTSSVNVEPVTENVTEIREETENE